MTLRDLVALSLLTTRLPRSLWTARQVLDQARVAGVGDSDAVLAWAVRTLDLGSADPAAAVARSRQRAAVALARARACNVAVVGWNDARYPAALAAIPDPPPVLWVVGEVATLETPAVAIVGARAASPYACEMARRLAADLARSGVTVVSGLARGVDAAAHQGALAAGRTMAVLGCGVDVVYPAEHDMLATTIAARGALVSELPPGAPPRQFHFPLRNRIISGLSRAIVVVEASAKSGALITARSGLDQGREVMAVPGNALTGRNRGAHALIKDGAKLVEGADDILEEIGLRAASPADTGLAACPAIDPLLELMTAGESYDLDALTTLSGLESAVLLPRLLDLELRGLIRREDGGQFVRSTGRW